MILHPGQDCEIARDLLDVSVSGLDGGFDSLGDFSFAASQRTSGRRRRMLQGDVGCWGEKESMLTEIAMFQDRETGSLYRC